MAVSTRPARGRSSDCRGHLGRNATILPVIKLLIRLRRADFGSSFKESPARLPFLHAANASWSNPWRLKPKVRTTAGAAPQRLWLHVTQHSPILHICQASTGISSLDGTATCWKSPSASFYFSLNGKTCSCTSAGHQDDLVIHLILYLQSRAGSSPEKGMWFF